MSNKTEKTKAVKTAEQSIGTEFVKVGAKYVEKPVQITPQITPAENKAPEAEMEYQPINLTDHPDVDVRDLSRRIEALKGSISAINSNGGLTDLQKVQRVTEADTQLKVATTSLNERLFQLAIGQNDAVFVNIMKFLGGQPFTCPVPFEEFGKLIETAKKPWRNPSVREAMAESKDTISDAMAKKTELDNIIKAEIISQYEMIKEEYMLNPLKVSVEYPEFLERLTGKKHVDMNSGKRTAVQTGTLQSADSNLSEADKKISDDDHKDMLAVITKDNVQEAINMGVNPHSNVDIGIWLGANKVGRQMGTRHSAQDKIYRVRKDLGYY